MSPPRDTLLSGTPALQSASPPLSGGSGLQPSAGRARSAAAARNHRGSCRSAAAPSSFFSFAPARLSCSRQLIRAHSHLAHTAEHPPLALWHRAELAHRELENPALLLLGLRLRAHEAQLPLVRHRLRLDLLQDLALASLMLQRTLLSVSSERLDMVVGEMAT